MWLQHNLTVACVVFLNRVHGGAKRAIVERTFLVRVSIQRVTPIILRYTALHSAYYAYIYCIALRARGVTHSRGTRVRATNRAPPPVTIIRWMDRSESLRFEGIPLLQTGVPRSGSFWHRYISFLDRSPFICLSNTPPTRQHRIWFYSFLRQSETYF